jgi:hypothetical protein
MKLSESAIGPYTIDVPDSILTDLHSRLEKHPLVPKPGSGLGWWNGCKLLA